MSGTRAAGNGNTQALLSAGRVGQALAGQGYLCDAATAEIVYLAAALEKPVLVEGPAGTGKTGLAKAVAAMTGARLIRLQCYEGLDESRALYEWDYRKQLLAIQASGAAGAQEKVAEVFSEEFLLERPLLAAIRAEGPVVLLIDEVDQLDVETEALLLEVLSDFQVSIPELGTVSAVRRPLVFLTSNNNRELSEALKRRCLFLHLGYPEVDRERDIVVSRVPGISAFLAGQISATVASLRAMELKKSPSVSETLDWARTLALSGAGELDAGAVIRHLPVLLKHRSDIERAAAELGSAGP